MLTRRARGGVSLQGRARAEAKGRCWREQPAQSRSGRGTGVRAARAGAVLAHVAKARQNRSDVPSRYAAARGERASTHLLRRLRLVGALRLVLRQRCLNLFLSVRLRRFCILHQFLQARFGVGNLLLPLDASRFPRVLQLFFIGLHAFAELVLGFLCSLGGGLQLCAQRLAGLLRVVSHRFLQIGDLFFDLGNRFLALVGCGLNCGFVSSIDGLSFGPIFLCCLRCCFLCCLNLCKRIVLELLARRLRVGAKLGQR